VSERASAIDGIRRLLRALRADGLDVIGPRPAAAARAAGASTSPATAIADEPPSVGARRPASARAVPGFRPRVAALDLPDPDQLAEPARERAERLLAIRSDLGECTRCGLCETRNSIVFGEGNPQARVVFVGEGPGEEEDRSGRPFVGRAGELLTKIIASVGWRREDVYICNIVKCRPPGNRDPRLEEVAMCQPFLERQLRAIGPRAIVTLGKPATSTLLGRAVSITRVRGQWLEWSGFPVLPTFHPAYLLRNYTRETRQAVWDDLKAVRARVEDGE
jgi:DNA polymerase